MHQIDTVRPQLWNTERTERQIQNYIIIGVDRAQLNPCFAKSSFSPEG